MEIKKRSIVYKGGKNKLLSIGASCVIFKGNKVLLVRGTGGTKFKFPGGHVDDEESIRQGAIREAKEELGVKVEVYGEPFFYLFKLDKSNDIILINYLAKIVTGTPKTNSEIEEIAWFDIDNLPETFDNIVPVIAFFKDRRV